MADSLEIVIVSRQGMYMLRKKKTNTNWLGWGGGQNQILDLNANQVRKANQIKLRDITPTHI